MITPIFNYKTYNNIYNFPPQKHKVEHKNPINNQTHLKTPICHPIYFTSNFNKEKEHYVLGHLKPDTDSVASAISYAHLKYALDGKKYTPVACGKLKSETIFALDYFGVKQPKIIEDFETKISDIKTPFSMDDKNILYQTSTVKEFGQMLLDNNTRSAPIVDLGSHKLLGMVSEKDLAKVFLSSEKVKNKAINFEAIKKTIGARIIEGENNLNQTLNGKLVVGASNEQTVINSIEENDLLIIGNRDFVQQEAIKKGAKCIIVTRNMDVSPEVKKLAGENNVVILSSPLDTYTTAKMVEQSMSVTNIMTTNPITLDGNTAITEVKRKIQDYPHRAYPVIENGEFAGIVEKVDILNPPERDFILVDHNDLNQSPKGIENKEISAVIDHHKSTFVSTREDRIDEVVKKCGSTSTIIAKEFRANGIEIPKHIAGLLLSGILSDTDILTSPTKEKEDVIIALELANIAGIKNIQEFGEKLLKAREKDVDNMTTYEALNYDVKEYENQKGGDIAIAQIFVNNPSEYHKAHPDIFEALNEYDKKNKTDGTIFMVSSSGDKKQTYLFASNNFLKMAQDFMLEMPKTELDKTCLNTTMAAAIELITKCNAQKQPAIFKDVTSRKAQIQPFATKIHSNA